MPASHPFRALVPRHGMSASETEPGIPAMDNVGYARVSTDDQALALQLNALRAAGCEIIYEDRLSGAAAHRPGLIANHASIRMTQLYNRNDEASLDEVERILI